MKIGLDIDGVLLDTARAYITSAEIFSLDVLGSKDDRLINKNELFIQNRYDWTDEEFKKWCERNLLSWANSSNFMPGAVEVVKKLQQMGHELYIITARGGFIEGMKKSALDKMKEKDLIFNGYYFNIEDKGEVCEKLKIDIMIDDSIQNCKNICERGIKVLYFRDVKMKKLEHQLSTEVNNWGEIYKYFKLFENK